MRLTISLACKGEIVERITSEACNMRLGDFTCLQGCSKGGLTDVKEEVL